MDERNYWARVAPRRLNRRSLLRATARAGVGAAGLALVGCGDDDDDDADDAAVAEQQAEQQADQATQAEQEAAAEQEQVVAEAADETPPVGGKIVTRDIGDIASFDGFATFGYRAFLHGHYVYPMLTQFHTGPDVGPTRFEPELWLAESVETPDPATYVFSIHPNAVWEDREPVNGRAVTAEDVAFSFEGERYGTYPNRGAIAPSLESVEVVDASTIRFNLNSALAPFLLYTGHHAGPYTMPPELLENELSRTTMVGAGPYMLDSYEPGSKVTYKRNPNYWLNPKPYTEDLEIVFMSDISAIAAAVRTGELNFTAVAPTVAPDLIDEIPEATWTQWPDVTIGGIFPDLLLEPFNDERVRQALSVSLNRDAVLASYGSPEGQWGTALPPLEGWWVDPKEDPEFRQYYAYDPTLARNLLDAAGIDELNDVPFHTTNAYGPLFLEAAAIVQANWKDVGINIDLVPNEATEHYSTVFGGHNVGTIGHTLSVAAIEPDEALRNVFTPDSARSPIPNGEEMGKDARLTELLDAQRGEPDAQVRFEILRDLQLHLAEKMYSVPWIHQLSTVYFGPEVRNGHWVATFAAAPVVEELWIEA